ncbi:PAS domain-containing protein [Paraburkholderia caballeronis]|uniref:PAS domain-containing protein n=1 Tax=Paraburkholderia caballeronis TaxID=416943 RepID=UPI0010EF6AB9|nr:PAS domain-containing protein [Paraburkholderia caballeronis]TDV03980.1 PAS domain-containing protein [Paraburkholderia caballeronis]TDV07073.1 PAS domain-containing protein [Paraburkholderia caballeronis]TDV17770.1 PAS domain-containing protein [Paraburkholderia caballeronis]
MNSNSDGSETMDRVSGRLPGADAFPVALLQIDAGGRVRGCNAAWIDALEAPAPDAPMAGYLHPEDRAIWSGMLQRLKQGGAATARERLRLVHPDGRLLWCDVSVRGVDDGFYVALADITQERRRETSTQVHLRSVLGLLDSLPGLIYRGRNNRLWTMEFISAGCEAVTGYPREWFLDSHENTFGQLIVPEDADYVWSGVQEALAARGVFDLRYRIRCADGNVKQVWETGVGIYSASGEVLGVEGVIFEVRPCYRGGAF